jgi:YetA-like protein
MICSLVQISIMLDACLAGPEPTKGAGTLQTRLLVRRSDDASHGRRCDEPSTLGVPLPKGLCHRAADIAVLDAFGDDVPLQVRILDRWVDGSVRWALLDLKVNSASEYTVSARRGRAQRLLAPGVQIVRAAGGLEIDTGVTRFRVPDTGDCLFDACGAEETQAADGPASRVVVQMTDADDRPLSVRIAAVTIEATGPLRATVKVEGAVGRDEDTCLAHFVARLHFFAGSPVVKVAFTLHNPRRAKHPGGLWELGDPGSLFFRDLSLRVAGTLTHVRCRLDVDAPELAATVPVSVFQASSGGDNWGSPVHVNREGRVPLPFKGYRFDREDGSTTGARATPVFSADRGDSCISVAMRHFWQNFPKRLSADAAGISVGLFPRQFGDVHELQGGERKTHVIGLAFGHDTVGDVPLEWILSPAIVSAEPRWYVQCEAMPYLTPATGDPGDGYERIVNAAIDGPDSFARKRERIDEYGWRNFGDIYADHEAVRQTDPPLISHYNNQYDAIGGFGIQFMRSGDVRWLVAMDQLAGHVTDIDIYHTTEDRPLYNQGLFWHTFHYVDAGKSSHRSYPNTPGVCGGGPSNEHAYSTGLLLHYLLTGDESSREDALGLAEWALSIEDGRRTILRWLTRADTGLSSTSGSMRYHGPGRGAANAIGLLLNGFRLTAESRFLQGAEKLIRRCIHPHDDLAARKLTDVERRWFYVVFLQALGRYLDVKIECGQIDEAYGYARESLLHYARWMADHEYPYLEKPDILEYPTETWAAQDMRKSEVFKHAARHSAGADHARFIERADYFWRTSIETLNGSATRTLARPVVLMLSNGYSHAAREERRPCASAPSGPAGCDHGTPVHFVPQREIAKRRLVALAGTSALALLASLPWIAVQFGWR